MTSRMSPSRAGWPTFSDSTTIRSRVLPTIPITSLPGISPRTTARVRSRHRRIVPPMTASGQCRPAQTDRGQPPRKATPGSRSGAAWWDELEPALVLAFAVCRGLGSRLEALRWARARIPDGSAMDRRSGAGCGRHRLHDGDPDPGPDTPTLATRHHRPRAELHAHGDVEPGPVARTRRARAGRGLLVHEVHHRADRAGRGDGRDESQLRAGARRRHAAGSDGSPWDGGFAEIAGRRCCTAAGYRLPVVRRTGHAGAVRALFRDADLALVNLEGPAVEAFRWHPHGLVFTFDPALLGGLREAGIDAVTIGNNHIGNAGPSGVVETVRHLDELGIAHVG